ncbi:MAG: PstS family phosphate ABC transporter substrate-binding protein [Methylococcaceae bacterium]|nr:PstS family phosphate ABC transporter substrate-binding protein [Methylococcaceae bacterium]MCI0733309.1 PstS family phosphate ABC transporter substrate-binding protein [Methylococcaceae bacterium]
MNTTSARAALLLAATVSQTAPAIDLIQVDGSSTVFPVTEAMAEEFQSAENGKTMVTVGVSGTGGGFKKFCRGDTDISDASRPIKDEEKTLCAGNGIEYIELPAALDALTVVINPENDWVDHLTVEELKKVWEPAAQGTISNWNQVRSGFPDRPLTLFGPGTDSGTYDYFVEAVVEGKSSRGDFTASEDDNVLVQGVATDVNAMGFFGLAYYEENKDKVKAAPISWKGGEPVAPSVETAKNATYQPLSRPIFIYVNKKSADSKPFVARFVEFYLNKEHAAPLVKEVGYVPLPETAYDLALEKFKNRVSGSVFKGAEVGVGIEELMARTPSH